MQSLKRFDVHTKAIDGVHQQTLLGAVLTLITTILVFVLLFSEISVFFKIDTVSRMVVDKSYGVEAVRLEFDISFPKISCDGITFIQEVTRGSVHFFEPIADVKKIDLDIDPNSPTGCRLTGTFLTDKVAGNFRFAIGPQRDVINLSHSLAKVSFQPAQGKSAKDKLPHVIDALSQPDAQVERGIPVYQYAITVVPTQYKTLYGELSFINQYTVTEKPIPAEYVQNFQAQNSLFLKDFQGVIFSYDFHPVMLFMEERRERIVDFISNLFGIIGGVITVLSLIEAFLHQSTKVLIGKND